MSAVIAIVSLLVALAGAAAAAEVRGKVVIGGVPAHDAVVYLERAEGPLKGPAPKRVVMDQRNLRFMPSVIAAQRGTVIEFHNSDDVQHNVFTPSSAGDRFNLGTYNRGEERSVKLDDEGEIVVLCNIHMEMEAHIVVLRDRSFALTDTNGGFRIGDLPLGTYRLRVWKRNWLEHEQRVRVTAADGEIAVEVSAMR